MRPDPRAYLWDASYAVGLLRQFSAGKSAADHESDAMFRSVVEWTATRWSDHAPVTVGFDWPAGAGRS